MKIVNKIRTGIFAMAVLFVLTGFGAQAAENTQFVKDTVWEAADDVTVREEPDNSTKAVGELEAGTPVVVSEDEKDGWCKVKNQTLEGYVQTSDLQVVNAEDAEALKQEFGVNDEFGSMVLEEYDYQKKQKRTSLIWGVVIGVLVIAIFAVGIVSAINSNKAEQDKEEQKEKADDEEIVREPGSNQKHADVEEMNIEEIGEDD